MHAAGVFQTHQFFSGFEIRDLNAIIPGAGQSLAVGRKRYGRNNIVVPRKYDLFFVGRFCWGSGRRTTLLCFCLTTRLIISRQSPVSSLRFRTAETGKDYQHHNAQQLNESKETESHLLTPSPADRQSGTANRNDKGSREGEWLQARRMNKRSEPLQNGVKTYTRPPPRPCPPAAYESPRC